jgi:hypothetical protein
MFSCHFIHGRKTMRNRGLLFAAAALTGMLLTNAADAQQPLPPAKTVNILGCASKGVELCLIIKDIRNGKTYQINAANPPPPLGRVVHLTGTIATIIDFCQQGPVLTNIKWKPTSFVCPRPKTK